MSNWWARRLSGETAPPAKPQPQPQPGPPAASAEHQPRPQYQRPPQSSLTDDVCPGCGSLNYMAPQGTTAKRCFDCGYPIQQSGSGVSGTGGQTDGSVKAAKQVPTDSYSPTTIVGRVD